MPEDHSGGLLNGFQTFAKEVVTGFDIQASALMNQPPAKVQKAAEQIRELFLFTILTDIEMQDAISKRTGSTLQTKVRWTKFRELVDPVIAGTLAEPRFFGFEFRKDLYDKSPVCQLCKNQFIRWMTAQWITSCPTAREARLFAKMGSLLIEAVMHVRTLRCRDRKSVV